MPRSLRQLLCCLAALLTGCGENTSGLEQRLSAAEAEMATLQASIKDLREKREWDELWENADKFAYLTPGADGYSVVRFDLGVLTIQLVDVKPYANGSKITLRFGNTLSSSVDGLSVKIDYGKVDARGSPDNDSAKTKDLKFSQIIRAGSWNAVSVVLEGVPPAELGFVRVKNVAHTGIRLNK